MHKIAQFKYIYSDAAEEDSTVFEKTPIGINWNYENTNFKLQNEFYRIHADINGDKTKIAVVEGPYAEQMTNNSAFIVNGLKKIQYDVKEMFKKTSNVALYDILFFEGVTAKDDDFIFFINLNGYDFRFLFNVQNGDLGELVESR